MINSTIRQYSIYWFDFGPNNGSLQANSRPAVIIQNDSLNMNSTVTIIAPLTTELKKTHMSAHVVLGRRFGLPRDSMILLEQLKTVNQNDLGSYIGFIDDPQIIKQINQGLINTLGIQSESYHSEDSSSEEVPV